MKLWDIRSANYGKLLCDECRRMVTVIVTFESQSQAADGEAIVVDVCPDCLRKALEMTMPDGPDSAIQECGEKALRVVRP